MALAMLGCWILKISAEEKAKENVPKTVAFFEKFKLLSKIYIENEAAKDVNK